MPDLVAQLVTFCLKTFELFRADLSQITEHMGAGGAVRVAAPRSSTERDPRQIQLMCFHRHHRGPIDVFPQDNIVERAPAFTLLEVLQKLAFLAAQIPRQLAQRGFRIFRVLGHEKKIKGRPAIDQQIAPLIVNHAARAENPLDANPIVLRQVAIAFALNRLQENQARHDADKRQGDKQVDQPRARPQLGGAVFSAEIG